MSWEHFGLEYMPVQKKGVEVLVTGLSGANDTTYYGWGTTITTWWKQFFYSEKFLENAQRFLPWVEQDVHNLGEGAYRNFGIVMVEGEFNGYTQASFFNAEVFRIHQMVRKAMEKDMEFEPGVKNVYHKVWSRYTSLPIDNPQPKTEKITLNGRTYELGYKDDICVFSGSEYLARVYRDPGLVRLRAVTFTRVDD